jgi:hypothetical protein
MATIRIPLPLESAFTAWLTIDASTQKSKSQHLPTQYHHYMNVVPVLFENGITEIMLVIPPEFGDSLVWRACVSMLGLDLARRVQNALKARTPSIIDLTEQETAQAWQAIMADVEASKG